MAAAIGSHGVASFDGDNLPKQGRRNTTSTRCLLNSMWTRPRAVDAVRDLPNMPPAEELERVRRDLAIASSNPEKA